MGQQQINMNIPIDQLKERVCPECEGSLFIQALTLKEIPVLYSPSGELETMLLPTCFICVSCGGTIPLRPEEEKEKPKIALVGGAKRN